MNVNAKYLKDENGDIISPIVSIDTIFKNNTTLLDLFYPVGTYYETSNGNFNPNESWGGTWVEDTKGYVTIGATTSYGVVDGNYQDIGPGTKIGEYQHTLTTDEMPTHTHSITSTTLPHHHTFTGTASSHTHTFTGKSHTHTYNQSNTSTNAASGNTGSTTLTIAQIPNHTHPQYVTAATGGSINGRIDYSTDSGGLNMYPQGCSTGDTGGSEGHTHSLNNHTHGITRTSVNTGATTQGGTNSNTSITPSGTIGDTQITINSQAAPVGGNGAFNVTQPSIGVIRWHRTA